jgi:hypothetical protein
VAAQRVGELRPLADQKIPGAEDHRGPLVLLAFTATNRIVGRCAASQIASASAMPLFWRFTNGLT